MLSMRYKPRIIARLDVKNNTVVKGIHLEGLRVVGVPSTLAKKYYDQGVDELLYMDAVASLYERNSLHDIIRQAAENVFIPLTVGGGIRTLDNIKNILRAGADKVAINTAAVRRPEFIDEAAKRFGSQCIVASIEAKKIEDGKWEAYVDTGRESTGLDVVEWAKQLAKLGAGELLITSIDREGTRKGFELDLVKNVIQAVSIPVIVCGGAGSIQHVIQAIKETEPSAIACASVWHYGAATVTLMKEELRSAGIDVRQAGNGN